MLCLDAWDTVAQLITYEATSAALFKALQQSVQERAEEMGGGQSAAANTASIDEVISSNAASLQNYKSNFLDGTCANRLLQTLSRLG